MDWLAIILAGCMEVFGVITMNEYKKTSNKWYILVMIVGFGLSLTLLKYALLTLPIGTGYAVWTGIGAVGGAAVGMLFYGEDHDWRRGLSIALVIVGVIGLRLID